MKQALIYSLKVWVTALLFSPIIAFPIWMLAEWLISYDKGYSTGIVYGIDINVSTIGMSMLWFVLLSGISRSPVPFRYVFSAAGSYFEI
jgi:hypothetical protein